MNKEDEKEKLRDLKLKESIMIEVLGQRYELNDKHISIIGKLIKKSRWRE